MNRTFMIRNTLKTTVLLASIGGLLVAAGALFGGRTWAVAGLIAGIAMCVGSYWFSDRIAIASSGAVPVSEAQAPQLYAIVRELAARAGTPMPRIYLIPEEQPNAFATGRNPEHAAVAVTTGLLDLCDYAEVRGVLAHELSHVNHRDILIGSIAAAIATAISFLANMAMWFGAFGGDDEERPNPVAALLFALLAPLAATVLQMALSRSREYEADRGGAELLGDPEPLARALAKLDAYSRRIPAHVNPAQASLYIVNPLNGRKVSFANLFSTHPPIEDRIARLRALRHSMPSVTRGR
ncbi:MAG: M48 family metalloprotease [Acidimicrobiales bacterium]|nr:M48 family metalloprotease [Acidimicrobiales bacterium]